MNLSLFSDPVDQIDTLAYDVSYIAQRHAHALSRFQTSDGRRSGHIYGVFKQIKVQVATLRPRRLAFLYDRGAPWRRSLVPDYKKSRREHTVVTSLPTEGDWSYTQPTDWSPAPEVERLCRTLPGLHLSLDDFEADDCAAVLRNLLPKEERQGSLVYYTMDKDYWQLVSDEDAVFCLLNQKKAGGGRKSDVVWIRDTVVEKAFGCAPSKVAALKAMLGDTSDDIRGLEGVSRPGKKKALLDLVCSDEITTYLDPSIPEWNPPKSIPDWLQAELVVQRPRLQANYQVTNLQHAAAMIAATGCSPVVTLPADPAALLSVLAEFECESHLGQVELLLRSICIAQF